jgi:phage gpG-like protein
MAIKFTYGGRNYEEAFEAFGEIAETFKKIKKEIGELTPLFNQIADPLVNTIKSRFDNDTLNDSPYNEDAPGAIRSVHTKLARVNPGGPTLKDSGKLQRSIRRLKSPTKSKSGGQREVSTLRIGTTGVPYAEDHLFGGEWIIEGWEKKYKYGGKQKSKFFTNFDAMNYPSGKTNSSMYGGKLSKISSYPQARRRVEIPIRNFLAIDFEVEDFINDNVIDFANRMLKKYSK